MPYQVQPTMKDVIDRLKWNFKNLGSDEYNPFVAAGEGDSKPKNRTAWEDVTHSIKNVWVEFGRQKLKAPAVAVKDRAVALWEKRPWA